MRPVFALLIAIGGSLLVSSPALAQEGQQIEVSKFFTWATAETPNWALGGLLAGLGLVGGLVTVFTLIGGAIPGTAGQAKIDADSERLDLMSKKLEDIITSPKPDPAVIAAIENTVNNLRDDLRTERWKQFAVAGFLYAVLGAFLPLCSLRTCSRHSWWARGGPVCWGRWG